MQVGPGLEKKVQSRGTLAWTQFCVEVRVPPKKMRPSSPCPCPPPSFAARCFDLKSDLIDAAADEVDLDFIMDLYDLFAEHEEAVFLKAPLSQLPRLSVDVLALGLKRWECGWAYEEILRDMKDVFFSLTKFCFDSDSLSSASYDSSWCPSGSESSDGDDSSSEGTLLEMDDAKMNLKSCFTCGDHFYCNCDYHEFWEETPQCGKCSPFCDFGKKMRDSGPATPRGGKSRLGKK